MEKKTTKTTRDERYRAIMEKDGFAPDEWHVWSFVFESESGPERFHYGLLPIKHAFVKVGDLYVDPTFERALHRDVRNEMYVSCIELDPLTMANYQLETGYYGELYVYDYMCKNRPELAAQIRARNPHNRR